MTCKLCWGDLPERSVLLHVLLFLSPVFVWKFRFLPFSSVVISQCLFLPNILFYNITSHHHHWRSHWLFLGLKNLTSCRVNFAASNLKRSITKSTSNKSSLRQATYSYSYWFHTILCKFMDLHTLTLPLRSSTFSSTTLWWRTFWAGRRRCPPRSCTLTSTASSRPTPRAARHWRSSSGWANTPAGAWGGSGPPWPTSFQGLQSPLTALIMTVPGSDAC